MQDFRNILGVCPHCDQFFRLTDLSLSYKSKPRKTFLDTLEQAEDLLERARERFEELREQIKERARERGRKQLPRLLKKADSLFSRRGYFPQDAKALFDPIDFIVFDGMTQKERIRRIVLFDGPATDRSREAVQRSVQRAVKAGSYDWRTIRIAKDGRVEA
jgi:predicted Holliday junction resolvase-like endonuclease